ncbi:MAG TPA: phosphodiester glycosidase family protein [Actinomycetota bacterium]|nr:phosphodiester glycosidase family protein [Actinomycetota bacterium]
MFGGGRIRAVALLVALTALIAPEARASDRASFPLPRGYTIAGIDHLADGVTHVRYVALSPRRNVNVAFIRPGAAARMKVVVSNDRIAGGTETVRSMCARAGCIMGVNADLFSFGSGQPAGGMASQREFFKTPQSFRPHLMQAGDGSTSIGNLTTTIRFFASYPERVEPFYIHGINVPRGSGQAVLYTPLWAPTTQTGSGFEITLAPVDAEATPRFGEPLRVRMVQGFGAGSSSLLPGTMVLSAHGPYATLLSNLWNDVLAGRATGDAELTFAAPPEADTFTGGWPQLLRGGHQSFTDRTWSFYSEQARTLAGRTADGTVMLAVIDGGRGSYWTGVRLLDAMRFMRSMGAVDALNMDGGGSSTFVVRGRAVNHPLRGERGVASALVLVPA